MSKADRDSLTASTRVKYYPAQATFKNDAVDLHIDASIRLHGHGSLELAKKPFKLSFTHHAGKPLYGESAIYLRSGAFDPTAGVREAVMLSTYRAMGVCAQRWAFTELWINSDYFGLYLITEHLSTAFVEARWGRINGVGNLFKLNGFTTAYAGEPWFFPFQVFNATGKPILRTNVENTGIYDVVYSLARLISNEPSPAEIAEHFEVVTFLRTLATEVIATSWDTLWGTSNNWFLLQPPGSAGVHSRLIEVPYDADLVFGTPKEFPCQYGGERTPYRWYCPGSLPRPLPDYILTLDRFRDLYSSYLSIALNAFLVSTSPVQEMILDIKAMIQEPAERVWYNESHALWPHGSFERGFTEDLNMTTYASYTVAGLLPFLPKWAASLSQHIEKADAPPVISLFDVTPSVVHSNGTLTVRLVVDLTNELVPSLAWIQLQQPPGQLSKPMPLGPVRSPAKMTVAFEEILRITCRAHQPLLMLAGVGNKLGEAVAVEPMGAPKKMKGVYCL